MCSEVSVLLSRASLIGKCVGMSCLLSPKASSAPCPVGPLFSSLAIQSAATALVTLGGSSCLPNIRCVAKKWATESHEQEMLVRNAFLGSQNIEHGSPLAQCLPSPKNKDTLWPSHPKFMFRDAVESFWRLPKCTKNSNKIQHATGLSVAFPGHSAGLRDATPPWLILGAWVAWALRQGVGVDRCRWIQHQNYCFKCENDDKPDKHG